MNINSFFLSKTGGCVEVMVVRLVVESGEGFLGSDFVGQVFKSWKVIWRLFKVKQMKSWCGEVLSLEF